MRKDTAALFRQAVVDAGAAATDPSRWEACVAGISEATNAAGTALFRPASAKGAGPVAVQGAMRIGVDSYWGHWVRQDPWNAAIGQKNLFRTAGEVYFGSELLSDAAYRRTAYFDHYSRHYDSGHKLFLKVCDDEDPVAPATHLSLSRSFSQEAFGSEAKSLIKRLWPQLRQAVRAHALLQRIPHVGHLAQAGLDQLPHPCWVLRSDHHVDFANREAESALGTSAWLRVLGGRLVRVGDWDKEALRSAIHGALLGKSHHGLVGYRSGPTAPLERATLRVLPIHASPLYAATWPQAVALLLLELPTLPDDGVWIQAHLAPQYRLTPNECRVLELLVAGHSVPQIAGALGVSDVTVRTHLRALREKTGRRTQADLVRLGLGR